MSLSLGSEVQNSAASKSRLPPTPPVRLGWGAASRGRPFLAFLGGPGLWLCCSGPCLHGNMATFLPVALVPALQGLQLDLLPH